MNPGGSVKDRAGALHHRRRREARRAEARRHHRGGHRRQYRHRPHAGRQRARLSLRHRDAGDAEQGEDRLPAHDRRRSAAGAGQAVSRSRQLRACLAPDGGGGRAARSGPTSSTTWPTARATARRTGPEIWEQTDGRVDAFTCACGTGGTLAGVGMALKAAQSEGADRAGRSRGQRAVWLGEEQRPDDRGQLDHRGHRQFARHRQPGGRADRRRGTHPGRGGAGAHLRAADP